MKKRKTAAFLAALMICAWVPRQFRETSAFLWPRPTAAAQTGTAATGTIKIRADWAATTITAAAIRPICTKTASAPMHLMWRRLLQRFPQRRRLPEAPENLYMVFDPIYYADHNPDLYEAFGYDTDQLQEHFLTCGMKEGRPGCADFNVAVYKEQNADLAAAYGDDLAAYYTHYMGCGHGEGRACH